MESISPISEGYAITLLAAILPTVIALILVPTIRQAARWVVERWQRSCEAERTLRIAAQEELEELKSRHRELEGRYSEESVARQFLEWENEMLKKGYGPVQRMQP